MQCDRQKPTCGQCQKVGIRCSGYERERLFVNMAAQAQKAPLKPSSHGEMPSISLLDSLAHSAYENKYLGLFWEAYLPGSKALPSGELKGVLGGWTEAIPDLYLSDDVLRKALLAMCLGTIGRRDCKKWMAEQGLKLYVEALQDMSAALSRPAKARSNALLTASKMFSMYEVRNNQRAY